jgi:hypothetical protein
MYICIKKRINEKKIKKKKKKYAYIENMWCSERCEDEEEETKYNQIIRNDTIY